MATGYRRPVIEESETPYLSADWGISGETCKETSQRHSSELSSRSSREMNHNTDGSACSSCVESLTTRPRSALIGHRKGIQVFWSV